MVYIDIDQEILYWIDQFGYEWIDCGRLIDYIKENYVRDQRDIVEEFIEVMEIKIPDIDFLDWNKICEKDNDYEKLGNGQYLNVYLLESDSLELKRMNLIE